MEFFYKAVVYIHAKDVNYDDKEDKNEVYNNNDKDNIENKITQKNVWN